IQRLSDASPQDLPILASQAEYRCRQRTGTQAETRAYGLVLTGERFPRQKRAEQLEVLLLARIVRRLSQANQSLIQQCQGPAPIEDFLRCLIRVWFLEVL